LPKQSEKRFAIITLLNNFGQHESYTVESLELPTHIKSQEKLNRFADEIAEENWEDGDVECRATRAIFVPEKDFLVLQKYGI